jgi:diguanylate cyclase (GGDEF)-like protein
VLSQGLVLLAGALLPTTAPADRPGLLLGAGLVGISGALWFLVVPRGLFGAWRVFVGSTVAQVVMLVTLATTGGLRSLYFPYYLLPLLVMVMAGSRDRTLALGAVAGSGLIGLGLAAQNGAADDAVRDLFVIRLLQLITFTFATVAASWAMGAIRTALADQARAFADQARADPLTGLGNRKALDEDLPRLLAAAHRQGTPLSVVALDVDGMKAVNDRHGHAAGDRLLSHFAALLRRCIRGQDLAVRSGGDEFILLLPDTDAAGAHRLVKRIRAAGAIGGPDVAFGAGVATSTLDATGEWLLALADDALNADKSAASSRQPVESYSR